MGWFTQNTKTIQDDDGELENMTAEMRQKLGDLECEEAILKDKERFGRVRASLMGFLRAKHGRVIADRALSRVSKSFILYNPSIFVIIFSSFFYPSKTNNMKMW